ncbi:MAG: hypothetical protein CVT48_02190 [Thermoplasmata archaeon HGW-Thermoplasmata-1]|nr:MAG: hypothetical protein CVT48_02190 [Thermoplasmata archaeon HGW-Thermoplasmata-1]
MADEKSKLGLKKLVEVWTDSDLKIEILVFFHNNPGVIDTVEGLAKRLGKTVDVVKHEIADHINIGILKERKIGDKIVLTYDKTQEQEIEAFIEEEINKKLGCAVNAKGAQR